MKCIPSFLLLVATTTLSACAGVPARTTSTSATEHDRASPGVATSVEGDLVISNETTLEGYDELEIVGGTLTIVGNTRLRNLEGLERLRAVGHLVVEENLALTTLDGLSGLRHAKSVTIARNPRLENLRGLEGLERLDRLVVTQNGIFCTIGVDGLTDIGELVISKNPRLLSLRGLSRLESAESVTIVENPRVTGSAGLFADLRQVTGKLEVRRNAGLLPSEIERLEERIQRKVELAER